MTLYDKINCIFGYDVNRNVCSGGGGGYENACICDILLYHGFGYDTVTLISKKKCLQKMYRY